MRRAILALTLVAAGLLGTASVADAQYRGIRYHPGRTIAPGVYVYPQAVTTPRYSMFPYYGYGYGYPYNYGMYSGYYYNPGFYSYSYSPYWGSSYYYNNPGFYSWYGW